MAELRIGRVAALAGVSVDTIRFYERRGLLPRAARRPSGYRVFDEGAVERVRLVRALVELGLGLADIRAMLDALTRRGAECASERPRLAAALARTEERIAELEATRAQLRAAITRCDGSACELTERARRLRSARA